MRTAYLKVIALIALTPTLTAHAEIQEITSMRETLSWITRDTIVVFDLDNTVMEPVQTIGSDQFFGFLLDRAKSTGLDEAQAKQVALTQAALIQPVSRVRAVESLTPEFIRRLQSAQLPVLALTARPIAWADATINQLASIGVHFDSNRILFAEGDKGELLLNTLQQSGLRARRIVFIDDKFSNVQSVERALETSSFEHISFRYGATDKRVHTFDSAVADFEWRYFLNTHRFLSDNQARGMMNRGQQPLAL